MAYSIQSALGGIDWNSLVENFCLDHDLANRVEDSSVLLAVWSGQLEKIDSNNPALAFVREMQVSGHHVASLIALGLFKPAAASMRSTVECALYYMYFREHIAELRTLARDPAYYVSKSDIIDFFKIHSSNFGDRQSALNLVGKLNSWYSKTSAIVHGQIPGVWVSEPSLGGGAFDKVKTLEVVSHFSDAVSIVQDCFICVLAESFWPYIDPVAKAQITKGMHGDLKARLLLS